MDKLIIHKPSMLYLALLIVDLALGGAFEQYVAPLRLADKPMLTCRCYKGIATKRRTPDKEFVKKMSRR